MPTQAYRPRRPAATVLHRTVREYLETDLVRAGCGHEFLIAFSCHNRDVCPSCSARRMAETAAHLTDQVLPRVSYRQWLLSVTKRVRWHLREKPDLPRSREEREQGPHPDDRARGGRRGAPDHRAAPRGRVAHSPPAPALHPCPLHHRGQVVGSPRPGAPGALLRPAAVAGAQAPVLRNAGARRAAAQGGDRDGGAGREAWPETDQTGGGDDGWG